MLAANPRLHAADAPDLVRAAFRELHGRRLHGFALLLTLGDGPGAARLAADAIAAGAERVDELRHPERAAAWLRARVVASSHRLRPTPLRANERLALLADLGAEPAVVAGLSALTHAERAALLAATLERLDRRDVSTIIGKKGPALERLLGRARRRYAAAYAAASERRSTGPLTARLHAVAERALG